MDTAFSYQGRLGDAGAPANGDYDFQFILYNAEVGGSQVGPIIYGDDIQVIDGYFTTYLDFGPGIFDGADLWLEVAVRPGASTGSYTTLSPRQAVLPSPYSLYSAEITWGDISGMPPDFADGVDDDTTYAPGNQLDLTGDTFDVVEGSGSGLDADTVDGQDSAVFAMSGHDHHGESWSGASGNGLSITESATTGTGIYVNTTGGGTTYGIRSISSSSSGRGVLGETTASSGDTYAVYGKTHSTEGSGVYGEATASSGYSYGVYGEASSDDGTGVYGVNNSTTGSDAHGVAGYTYSQSGQGVYGRNMSTSSGYGILGETGADTGWGVVGRGLSLAGSGVWGATTNGIGVQGTAYGDSSIGVYGFNHSNGGYAGYFANLDGGVLIAAGTSTDPATNLKFKVDSSGNVYADGGYKCGNNIVCGGDCEESELDPCLQDNTPADFAEMLPTAEETEIAAGEVLVIRSDGRLAPSTAAFDSAVAGVRSTRPSYLGNSRMRNVDGYEPLAIVGIVPVKAVAENGPITPGDMLVSSSVQGHAMRGGDGAPQGTVIGKALEGLVDGSGTIQMVVMMQ